MEWIDRKFWRRFFTIYLPGVGVGILAELPLIFLLFALNKVNPVTIWTTAVLGGIVSSWYIIRKLGKENPLVIKQIKAFVADWGCWATGHKFCGWVGEPEGSLKKRIHDLWFAWEVADIERNDQS